VSDFYGPRETRKARIPHRCTYCGEAIPVGTQYEHQTGVYDGRWFTNKAHTECFAVQMDDGDEEFTRYSNERPKKEPR